MKVPEYFATERMEVSRLQPPGGLPRAPAKDLAYTGKSAAVEEAKALGGFGRAIFDVSSEVIDKIIEYRSETQFLEGSSQWERANTKFFTDLETDQNFDGYNKKYKAFAKSLRKQVIRKGLTGPARRDLEKYIENHQVAAEKKVAAAFLEKQKDYGRASMIQSISDFEKAGDADGAVGAINSSVREGVMSAQEGAIGKLAVMGNVEWYKGLQMIDTDPEGFEHLCDLDADGTIDFTFLPDLDYNQKVILRNRARAEHGRRLALGRGARAKEINAEQGRLMTLARKDELSDDIIRGSKLDEFGTGSKATFYSMIDQRYKATLVKTAADRKEAERRFKESVPEVKATILDEIRDPLSEMTAGDIAMLVGNGLSVDDADRMIARLDVFKSFWFTRADRDLKQLLGWSDVYTKFMHPEGALSYQVAMNELFDAIETENLRDRPLYDRARGIAIPLVVDYWEKVLMLEKPQIERMKAMLKGRVTTEPEKPTTKTKTRKPAIEKADLIDPEGIWQ